MRASHIQQSLKSIQLFVLCAFYKLKMMFLTGSTSHAHHIWYRLCFFYLDEESTGSNAVYQKVVEHVLTN